MKNKLEQLRTMTDVVADTGDIDAIRLYQPQDATTNPALVLKAAQTPSYRSVLVRLVQRYSAELPERLQDRVATHIGADILSIVPGFVSTEVDARLSFDAPAMIARAKQLLELYQEQGVDIDRVLIKLAATWEGIKAAEALEKQGIKCNLTLLFSFAQAQACADAGVFLISPFVGRIMDWYKAKEGRDFEAYEDPGVLSVCKIFEYYKSRQFSTIVMGASFRNQGEVEALAGCDKLTISPILLEQLAEDQGALTRRLKGTALIQHPKEPDIVEALFRWSHNEDPMAVEKLSEGIRRFADDQKALEQLLFSLKQP